MRQITFILGGVLSGKSRYALQRGNALSGRKYFLATVQALDEKTVRRIEACKAERSSEWTTLEESIKVPDVMGFLHKRTDVLIIDSLADWLTNLLIVEPHRDLVKDADLLIETIKRVDYSMVIVSTEVGCGLLPLDPVSQRFGDTLAPLHQTLAEMADEMYFMVAGRPLRVV